VDNDATINNDVYTEKTKDNKIAMNFKIFLTLSLIFSSNASADIYRKGGIENGKVVALTFDDGPDRNNTTRVLDILDKHGVPATFFVVGRNIRGNEKLLKRMACSGHIIANHSWAHRGMSKESSGQTEDSIMRTEKEITRVVGGSYMYFRPPYGDVVYGRINSMANKYGMKTVMWSIDSLDWRRGDWVGRSSQQLHSGGVILMHDIHYSTASKLDDLLQMLDSRGYKVVPLTDLIKPDQYVNQVGNCFTYGDEVASNFYGIKP